MMQNLPSGSAKPDQTPASGPLSGMPKSDGTYQKKVDSFVAYLEGLKTGDIKSIAIGERILSPRDIAAELRKDPESFRGLVDAFAHEIASESAGGHHRVV